MNCLITGAGGSIGVHMLAHVMQVTDWNVIATDSFRHKGYFDRIEEICRDHPDWRDRIEIMTHDLAAPFSGRQIHKLRGVDHIIHLASLSDVEDSIRDPVPFIRNNVDITLNMLELAREIKPKSFVLFSTDEVYGPEAIDGNGHLEWDVILPSNPYSASKAAQEAIAISYWRSYGVPLVITNTMNNFGEMQSRDKYPLKVQRAVAQGDVVEVHTSGDGQIGSRFYVHSRNVADAVMYILRNTEPYQHKPGECDRPDRYNVVGDMKLGNLELAKEIAELMGRKLKYESVNFHANRPGHDLHYGLDGTKLKTLGWEQPVGFRESMSTTIKWQSDHAEWIA